MGLREYEYFSCKSLGNALKSRVRELAKPKKKKVVVKKRAKATSRKVAKKKVKR